MKPWEIAEKLLPSGVNGQTVNVADATDQQFQVWIVASGLGDLLDETDISEWSFDDRCRFLNFALQAGYALKFVSDEKQKNSQTIPESELNPNCLEGKKPVQEGA